MKLINHFDAESYTVDIEKLSQLIPAEKRSMYIDDENYHLSDIADDFDNVEFFEEKVILSLVDDDNSECFSLTNIELAQYVGLSWVLEEGLYASYYKDWLLINVSWASGQGGTWLILDTKTNSIIAQGDDSNTADSFIWSDNKEKLVLIKDFSCYSSSSFSITIITKSYKVIDVCLVSKQHLEGIYYQHDAVTYLGKTKSIDHSKAIITNNTLYFNKYGSSYKTALGDIA